MRQTPLLLILTLAATSPLQGQRAFELPNKEVHSQRRARFLDAMDGGIAIIVAALEDQDNIYEFFVDHSDLHDFIYLTGLEGIEAWQSALVLAPDAEIYREILYSLSSLSSSTTDRCSTTSGFCTTMAKACRRILCSPTCGSMSLLPGEMRARRKTKTHLSGG